MTLSCFKNILREHEAGERIEQKRAVDEQPRTMSALRFDRLCCFWRQDLSRS
jgi:hypothetical protein